MIELALLAAICFLIGMVLADLWARRRNILPQPRADHVHTGSERSRHEVSGRTVIVFECRDCLMHFNGEV